MMRRPWSLLALSLLCAACAGGTVDDARHARPSPVSPGVAAGPSSVGTPPQVTAGEATDARVGPTRTMDPTREAFYRAFELPVRGDEDAPVALYEFSDYLCSFCRRFALETARAVETQYVRTGRVRIVFYDYPIPAHGLPAVVCHEAAHCAGEQGRYWQMHDALFARQEELARLDPRNESAAHELLRDIGRDAGVAPAALGACLADRRYRAVIAGLADAAQAKGVSVTPTLIVSGGGRQEVVPGYVSFDDLVPYLDRALAPGANATAP